MFDDKRPQQPSALPVLPSGDVEDMFGEEKSEKEKVKSRENPSILAPSPVPPQPATAIIEEAAPRASRFGFLKVVFVVLLILLLVAGAAYAAYRIMVLQPEDTSSPIPSTTSTGSGSATSAESSTPASTTLVEPEKKNPATFLDTDGDGLTNAKELEVGTSSTNSDTDGDGLGDREEVEVYDTNPLKPDTDGDTFLDGQEVAGGYNPNGAGRLFSVPE